MGGKTGTAEKLPRKSGNYVVSFIGFAPVENPQLVIYCVIDEPNSASQPHSYYAQNLCREILEDVFPYMNIYQDEELTGKNEGLDIIGTDPYYTGNHTPEEDTLQGTPVPEEGVDDVPDSLPGEDNPQTGDTPEGEDTPQEE